MNLAVLEVAIGLAFVYLLLAILASSLYEALSAALNLRGKTLWEGIDALLRGGDPLADSEGVQVAAALRKHPLVAGTMADGFGARGLLRWIRGRPPTDAAGQARLPSYLAGPTFAIALMDTLRQRHGGRFLFADAASLVAALPSGSGLRRSLDVLVEQAQGDADALRRGIEQWFDASMERVSGWYKRRSQVVLTVIGLMLAVSINVDSIVLAQRLWTEPILRAALAQQAEQYVKANAGQFKSGNGEAVSAGQRKDASDALQALSATKLPIGWPTSRAPSCADLLLLALGWIITGIAAGLGAPFWFDALSKLVSLRASGAVPPKAGDAPGAKETAAVVPAATPPPSVPPTFASGTAALPGALNDYEGRGIGADDLRRLRRALGLAEGDGVYDQALRDAVRQRQLDMGWPPSGQLSAHFIRTVLER